jgi:hypothetical protein
MTKIHRELNCIPPVESQRKSQPIMATEKMIAKRQDSTTKNEGQPVSRIPVSYCRKYIALLVFLKKTGKYESKTTFFSERKKSEREFIFFV